MPAFLLAFYERFGLNAYVQGDYTKALAWFRKLEAREPDSIRTLRNIGVVLLASGDAAGAERYLLREEKLYGSSFNRHSALADIAYARGARKEAEKRYAAALADPDARPDGRSVDARPFVEARLALCRSEAAFAASREGAKRFTEAEAARTNGEIEKALALFEEAASLDPTHWPALNNAGTIALNTMGDAARAKALFLRAFELARSPQVARNIELAEDAHARTAKASQAAKREGKGRETER